MQAIVGKFYPVVRRPMLLNLDSGEAVQLMSRIHPFRRPRGLLFPAGPQYNFDIIFDIMNSSFFF